MLARFYWQENAETRLLEIDRSEGSLAEKRRKSLRGWLTLVWLSAGFALWLLYRWLISPAWLDGLPVELFDFLQISEVAGALAFSLVWALLFLRIFWAEQRADLDLFSKDELLEFSPHDFERYVASIFRRKGLRVRHRGGSGDHGVDLELFKMDGSRAIVQCKRYQRTVGEEVVRDLFGTLVHERATRAFLVTTAEFSAAAYAWASDKPITLIDGRALVEIAGLLAGKAS